MKTQTQPLVVTKTIQNAVRMLEASGAQFKVISPDGTEYGVLKVESPRKKKMNPDREYGELRAYYDRFIDYNAPVGTVLQVPHNPKYKPEEIRGGLCAKLTTRWGKGTYTTAVAKNGTVEIMRIA